MARQTALRIFLVVAVAAAAMTVSVAEVLQNVSQGVDDEWPALNDAVLDRMLGKFTYISIMRRFATPDYFLLLFCYADLSVRTSLGQCIGTKCFKTLHCDVTQCSQK